MKKTPGPEKKVADIFELTMSAETCMQSVALVADQRIETNLFNKPFVVALPAEKVSLVAEAGKVMADKFAKDPAHTSPGRANKGVSDEATAEFQGLLTAVLYVLELAWVCLCLHTVGKRSVKVSVQP